MSALPEAPPADLVEFVTFGVAGQKYCLEITQIREIRRWSPVTALPHSAEDVLGVMNLRGSVIAIFDLSARFGIGFTKPGERNVVIVAMAHGNQIGLLVESVAEIVSIASDDIQPTPDVKSHETRECISGVISINDEMVRVINLDAITEQFALSQE